MPRTPIKAHLPIIEQLYKSGLSRRQVADELGLNYATLCNAINMHDLVKRKRHFMTDHDKTVARQMWRAAHPVIEIARHLGFDRTTIYGFLRRHGMR